MEVKDGIYVSDKDLNVPNPFVNTGYLYATWPQNLYGQGLLQKKNKSLEKGIVKLLNDSKQGIRAIYISSGTCKVILGWENDYTGV